MRNRGFTLIEMMTVVALFGLVAIYVGRILTVNERAYHTVEETSESQQNLRLFGEMVEDDVRHAGMMVPMDAAVCGVDAANAPDVLYVSDAAAIDPQDDFDPYDGVPITGGVSNLAIAAQLLQLSSLVVEPSPPNRPAYDTNNDGNPDSDFRWNGGIIVVDLDDSTRGVACGRVLAVDTANSRLWVQGLASLAAGAGTNLVAVPANEYRINGIQLLWNGIALAEGIEDLQVGYIFDEDEDNVVDAADDHRGLGDGNDDYDSSEYAGNLLREIRLALVSRARAPDPSFVGRPQAFLNRTPITTPDGFRRRTFETRIRLRNLVARFDT